MNEEALLMLRISEIAIKGPKTRRRFLSELVKHLGYTLRVFGVEGVKIKKTYSRIFVKIEEEQLQKAKQIIKKLIPGVASVSEVTKVETKKEAILSAVEKRYMEEIKRHKTFAVRVKRTGKHTFTSMELAAEIGAFILEKCRGYDIKVNLSKPEYILYVDVQRDETFIFEKKEKALGGLPAETQGKVLVVTTTEETDLINIIELYARGAITCVVSIKKEEDDEKERIKCNGTIERLLELQPTLKKENYTIVTVREENVKKEIIELYEKNNCLAICMTKKMFFRIEKDLPVKIPIFVPDIVDGVKRERIKRIVKTVEMIKKSE